MYYGYGIDPTYILVIIGLIICLLAQAKMKSTFGKYSRVRNHSGMTGREAAERILRSAGIHDVQVEHVPGNLTDHYDPRSKVLRLSDSVYNNSSVAAIGVAAHECGHAVQHDKSYAPLAIRTAIVPAANIGAALSWPLILIGLMIGMKSSSFLITAGILLFSLSVLFQIVTLPVEFNASRRAIRVLSDMGILYGDEVKDTKKVLFAAALTYVAAAAGSILQLVRLIMIGRRDD